MNNDDILKYALESGMLNLDTIQREIDMRRRKEILEKHPYKIWLGADGYWHTHLPEKSDTGRKRAIKKKTQQDIESVVIDYWEKENNNQFKKRFNIWVNRQQALGRSDNTIYKYECDYKRFIAGDKIEEMDIKNITSEEIGFYLLRLLSRQEVNYRALKGLFGYLNGVFEKAIIDDVIQKNPCNHVDLPMFKKKCAEVRKKTAQERTFSDSEKKVLLKKIDTSTSMARFAVELAIYTGMRVGELSALKWSDIDYKSSVINVVRSEKHNQKTGEYFIDTTKNDKHRQIPLTESMKDVLRRTKVEELKHGYTTEFVFSNEHGRVHASVISDYARNHTMSNEFTNTKSVHALRRTLNSNMKCMGVSTTVAASILGHTEKVNEENYTYDISSLEDKKKYIELAGKIS